MTPEAAERLARAFTIVRGLLYASGFVALWSWLALTALRLDPGLPVTIPRWLAPIGIVIAVAGALLAAACVATFATWGRGTPALFDPPQVFVAVGPYRYVRNPMYVGGAAAILGTGLILGSPSIVLLAAGFLLVAHLFVIFYEEPALVGKFGDSYLRYRSSVHRWIVRKPRLDGPDRRGEHRFVPALRPGRSGETDGMRRHFIVLNSRGPAWDDSRPMEEQTDWAAHASFMDALTAEGFILFGGPLEGTRDAMLIAQAQDASEIGERLAADPWRRCGLLVLKECRPWRIRLGSLP